MVEISDLWCLCGNVIEPDSALRQGAKVLVTSLGIGGMECDGRVYVRGLSKSGAPIEKIVALKKLRDLRPAFVPPNIRDKFSSVWANKSEAQAKADQLRDQTYQAGA